MANKIDHETRYYQRPSWSIAEKEIRLKTSQLTNDNIDEIGFHISRELKDYFDEYCV